MICYINDSKFQLKTNIDYESNINRLDINYFGINLSHLDIESVLLNDNIKRTFRIFGLRDHHQRSTDIIDFILVL